MGTDPTATRTDAALAYFGGAGDWFASITGALAGVDLSLYRDIVEASPVPILLVASAGSQPVQYANAAFHRISGYSRDESVGHDWIELFADEPGNPALIVAQQAISAGRDSRQVLWARRKDGSRACVELQVAPLQGDLARARRCVMLLHDVTAERRAQATLELQAHFDALTGLANRHLLYMRFEELLTQAPDLKHSFRVVLLDMNDFKMVNDCFGHEIGDALLRCVAERLSRAARAHDLVARLGGDEFVVLLSDLNDGGSAEATIGRIVDAVEQPVEFGRCQLRPSCCIGVSHCPQDAADRESLLRAADRALYRAKAARPSEAAHSAAARRSWTWNSWQRFRHRAGRWRG